MKSAEDASLVPFRSGQDLIGPLLAAFPHIGGPLSALWSQWDTNRRFQRIEETIAELQRLLASPRYILHPEELGDEEMQLLETALHHAQMAHTERKRAMFARLIASSWTESRERPFDERLRFVTALAEFNDYHIHTLSILNSEGFDAGIPYRQLLDQITTGVEDEGDRHSIMIPVLETLCSDFRFVRRAWGLNEEGAQSLPLLSGSLSPEGIAMKCNHAITRLGERFMLAISDVPVTQS